MDNSYNQDWQKEFERNLAENFICRISLKPCTNCSKYGCEHREYKSNIVATPKISSTI